MKGACSDKENVVSTNHAVARVYRGAFDYRQNIALHTFTGNVRAVAGFAAGHFIDLVDKNDAHLFGALDRGPRDLVHVEQFVLFFLNEVLEGVSDAHLAFLFLLAEHTGKHVLDVDVHLLNALVGDDFKRRHGAFADLKVHHPLIELSFAKLRAQLFASALRLLALLGQLRFACSLRRRRRRRQEEIKNAFLGGLLGTVGNFVELFLADHVDRRFHQVAHHGFHIAADVTDFGIFGSLHLNKGTAGETCQAPRNFRFADAGRSDHQNIFRQDILCDFRRKLLAAHAVAERYRNGALGGVLADDILVQLRDNLPRSHVVERGKKLLSLFRRGAVASGREDYFFFRLAWHESFCSIPSSPLVPSYLRCEKNAQCSAIWNLRGDAPLATLFLCVSWPAIKKRPLLEPDQQSPTQT